MRADRARIEVIAIARIASRQHELVLARGLPVRRGERVGIGEGTFYRHVFTHALGSLLRISVQWIAIEPPLPCTRARRAFSTWRAPAVPRICRTPSST